MRRRRSGPVAILQPGEAAPGDRPFVIAVPGAEAPLHAFDLPAGVRGQARTRIAAQQLADRLGARAATLDILPVGGADWDRAVVCEAEARRRWLGDPAASHRGCRGVRPDYLCLAAAEGEIALARAGGGTVAVRLGPGDGFAAPDGVAAAVLGRALADGGFARATLGPGVDPALRTMVEGAVGTLRAAAPEDATASDVDLRRHGTGRATATVGLGLAAAVLALVALGLWSAALVIETRAARAAADGTRAATVARLRDGLIPDGPILDIRQQVARALAAPGPAGTLPPDPLARLSAATVAVFGRQVEVEALEYVAGGPLVLSIGARDFAAVDALVASMAAADLPAAASALRTRDGGGVTARIEVAPPTEEPR